MNQQGQVVAVNLEDHGIVRRHRTCTAVMPENLSCFCICHSISGLCFILIERMIHESMEGKLTLQ